MTTCLLTAVCVLLLSTSPDCKEAVAALARYVVLKTPDKADFRSLAVDCAIKLIADLPTADRNRFVVFVARLSRTAKVVQLVRHLYKCRQFHIQD